MYTVLKLHLALWKQPRGCCGPPWKWVRHPCFKVLLCNWARLGIIVYVIYLILTKTLWNRHWLDISPAWVVFPILSQADSYCISGRSWPLSPSLTPFRIRMSFDSHSIPFFPSTVCITIAIYILCIYWVWLLPYKSHEDRKHVCFIYHYTISNIFLEYVKWIIYSDWWTRI